ncbi:unnamed protein product, partial [Meganyctiphanes norvegica]
MQLLRRLIVPLVVAVAAVDCRSQLEPDSVHPIITQRGATTISEPFYNLYQQAGGGQGVGSGGARQKCYHDSCKISKPDNQCLANEGRHSVLWNKINTTKMDIQETINKGNADVIGTLETKIDLLEVQMNYVISLLDYIIEHRECPGGVILGKQCFIFSNDSLNWTDAAEACGRNGGQLAVVSQQPTLIAEYILTYYDNVKFWVGATDTAVEGSWVWIDGQPMDSQFPWPSNQPDNGGGNEHCLMFNYEDAYNDDPCYKEFRYVCEQI